MNGKIIYKWVIYTMAMLNNQRVPHFHVQLSYLCGPTLASPLSQASSNVSQVELRHVLQRLQSLGPQKQVPGRPGTSGHGEVSRILSDFDRTQEIWTYFRNINHEKWTNNSQGIPSLDLTSLDLISLKSGEMSNVGFVYHKKTHIKRKYDKCEICDEITAKKHFYKVWISSPNQPQATQKLNWHWTQLWRYMYQT